MSKIDHLPIVQALRKMEQYQEKHFPVESLDATYPEWALIVQYIEGKERAKLLADRMGIPSAQEMAKMLVVDGGKAGRKS